MTIYLVMLAISLFFAVYAQRARPLPQIRSTYITFCVLAALPFIIVTVLRYRVGTDYASIYENGYDLLNNYGIESFPDPGFSLIFRFFGLFTDDAWWAISFVGLLTMIFFFKAFYHESVSIPISILIFFICGIYFQSLNALRQLLATSIFLYSVRYLKARDWKRYFFWNLLGMTMHATSFIYLPIYFLYGLRATPKRCLVILGAAFISYPLLGVLMRLLVQVIPRFSRYIGTYQDAREFSDRTFLTVLFLTLVHIFYLARYPKQDKDFEWMTYMMIVSTAFLLFSARIPGALRAADGLSVIQVFSYPLMFKKETDDRMRVLVGLGIIGLVAVRFFVFEVYLTQLLAPIPWYGVLPYKWVFSR